MSARRRRVGQAGEDRAARWYRDQGYEVVARNWRCREGELDLIAQRGSMLVICEVKARTSDRFGSPFAAVTPAKQLRLRKLTTLYLREHPHRGRVRIDVAAVTAAGVEVIEAAC